MKILQFNNDSWLNFIEYCFRKKLISGINIIEQESNITTLAVFTDNKHNLDEAIKSFGPEVIA